MTAVIRVSPAMTRTFVVTLPFFISDMVPRI
jgi:hypothetical protein